MLTTKQKIHYLADSLFRYFEPKVCPFCNSTSNRIIDRKYFVTRLLECDICKLKYRHPYDSIETNNQFYQKSYVESDLLTADLPKKEDLNSYVNSNFKVDPNKDVSRIISLIELLMGDIKNLSLIDYGSSWGYMSYQFKREAKQVQSFEISEPRKNYGNDNLGLNIVSDENDLEPNVDIFFSSHVIEHVPDISHFINLALELVKPGGYIITLCPNGSDYYKNSSPESFHKAWGKVHPNFLNELFFQKAFRDKPIYIGSTPIQYEHIKKWNSDGVYIDSLEGIELLTIVQV